MKNVLVYFKSLTYLCFYSFLQIGYIGKEKCFRKKTTYVIDDNKKNISLLLDQAYDILGIRV